MRYPTINWDELYAKNKLEGKGVPNRPSYIGWSGKSSVDRYRLSTDPKDKKNSLWKECKGVGEGPAF